jgi:hypothetical protein
MTFPKEKKRIDLKIIAHTERKKKISFLRVLLVDTGVNDLIYTQIGKG